MRRRKRTKHVHLPELELCLHLEVESGRKVGRLSTPFRGFAMTSSGERSKGAGTCKNRPARNCATRRDPSGRTSRPEKSLQAPEKAQNGLEHDKAPSGPAAGREPRRRKVRRPCSARHRPKAGGLGAARARKTCRKALKTLIPRPGIFAPSSRGAWRARRRSRGIRARGSPGWPYRQRPSRVGCLSTPYVVSRRRLGAGGTGSATRPATASPQSRRLGSRARPENWLQTLENTDSAPGNFRSVIPRRLEGEPAMH